MSLLQPLHRPATVVQTLQHELVHVLTGSVLMADGPAWAAEGLAQVATGARSPGCGRDDESLSDCGGDYVARAVSRPCGMPIVWAGACVEAALPAGLDTWRTLTLR